MIGFINPPGRNAPKVEWRAFLERMRRLPQGDPQVEAAVREAVEALARRGAARGYAAGGVRPRSQVLGLGSSKPSPCIFANWPLCLPRAATAAVCSTAMLLRLRSCISGLSGPGTGLRSISCRLRRLDGEAVCGS